MKKIRKKVVDKMEDEAKSVPTVGLKSRMYSVIKEEDKGGKKTKGINNKIFKNMAHEEYENALFVKKQATHQIKRIQSKSHQLGKFKINKISQSGFDNKLYTPDHRIKIIVYRHNDIN